MVPALQCDAVMKKKLQLKRETIRTIDGAMLDVHGGNLPMTNTCHQPCVAYAPTYAPACTWGKDCYTYVC